MALNTLKTTIGYLITLVRKYSPIDIGAHSIRNIYNFLPINENLSTSGQPTEKQFVLIKEQGYTKVVNLAPHHAENALDDEQAVLDKLKIEYIHIPVDFKNPTDKDFECFVCAMNQFSAEKVWVHCAANMRVSAFIYRYRL